MFEYRNESLDRAGVAYRPQGEHGRIADSRDIVIERGNQ